VKQYQKDGFGCWLMGIICGGGIFASLVTGHPVGVIVAVIAPYFIVSALGMGHRWK